MTLRREAILRTLLEQGVELAERIGVTNARDAKRYEEAGELRDWIDRVGLSENLAARRCTAHDLGLPPLVVSEKERIQNQVREIFENAATRIHVQKKGETISVWANFYEGYHPDGWMVFAISGDPDAHQDYDLPGRDYIPHRLYEDRPADPDSVKQCPGCKMAIYDDAALDGWCTNCNPNL